MRRHTASIVLSFVTVALLAPGSHALAWTPQTQLAIGAWAARIAPPDLKHQLFRREEHFRAGILAPFGYSEAASPDTPDSPQELRHRIAAESQQAIRMIRSHEHFDEVVRQLGIVSHYVARLADPLMASDGDPMEARYAADYRRYVASAQDRFTVVFYGLPWKRLDGPEAFADYLARSVERTRRLYPAIGREYRRVSFADGRQAFDDRSTAFGVAAVAFSQGVTDVAVTLRYIWLAAGGGDTRAELPVREP